MFFEFVLKKDSSIFELLFPIPHFLLFVDEFEMIYDFFYMIIILLLWLFNFLKFVWEIESISSIKIVKMILLFIFVLWFGNSIIYIFFFLFTRLRKIFFYFFQINSWRYFQWFSLILTRKTNLFSLRRKEALNFKHSDLL